jgi:uncharacterized membrane protein YeaQ/YmgE (transglycosylase-associated protein family)
MYPSCVEWIAIWNVADWLTGKLVRGAGYGILMDLIRGLAGAEIGGLIFNWLGRFSYGSLVFL